jgi:hypothetical protein
MTEEDVPFPSWAAWNRIRNGEGWPGFEHERAEYEAQKAFAAANVKHTSCAACKERFSDANCHTQAGWQETQISGMCERCFDDMTAEPKEGTDDFDPYEAAGESPFGLPGGGSL